MQSRSSATVGRAPSFVQFRVLRLGCMRECPPTRRASQPASQPLSRKLSKSGRTRPEGVSPLLMQRAARRCHRRDWKEPGAGQSPVSMRGPSPSVHATHLASRLALSRPSAWPVSPRCSHSHSHAHNHNHNRSHNHTSGSHTVTHRIASHRNATQATHARTFWEVTHRDVLLPNRKTKARA